MSARVIGLFLTIVSIFSIAQTIREIVFFESGESKYAEANVIHLPARFGGHLVSVADDQPHLPRDENDYYKSTQGRIQLLIDSQPLGKSSAGRIRVTLDDLGRYFGWVDVWQFKESNVRDSSLWVARRIQETPSVSPLYEITTIDGNGAIVTDTFPPWRLGTDYRRFRATQFMQSGAQVMPLSVADMLGMMPVLVLVFPLGTLLLGVLLLGKRKTPPKAAGV
jgi:hypothetical protein